MENKKGFVVLLLSIILVLMIIILGFLIFIFYFSNNEKESVKHPKIDFNNNSDSCTNIKDDYVLPDFDRAKNILSQQQIVKDVPSKAKISLKFYHFVGECRKWDKIYLLSYGKIEEKDTASDIEIWISSDYVNKINSNNLCDVVAEARKNGDLGNSVNIGNTKLMWTYKSMLKYKDCLGL